MSRFELILKNSLGLEIARHPVPSSDGIDEIGDVPEVLAALNDIGLRQSLHVMQPGDTIELVDNEDV